MAKSQKQSKSEGEAPIKKRAPKQVGKVGETVGVVVPPKVRYVNPLIDYRNVEQKGRTKAERSAFFDLHCTTSNDEYIIIEMQKMPQPFFADRVLYYVSLLIQKQAKRGNWDFNLKPIYFVGILNFKISDDTNKEEYHHEVQLSDFNKTEDELKTNYDWWLYVLKNLSELKEIPEELNLYDESLKNYWNMTQDDIVKVYKKELATSKNTIEKQDNTIEKQGNTIESLKSSNKNLQSSNRNLQSSNAALQRQIAEYQRKYGILNATSGALS